MGTSFEQVVENAGRALELVGVGVIVVGVLASFVQCGLRIAEPESYRLLRRGIGRSVIVGLEVLVAGDLIRTVVVAPTFSAIGVLGAIVLVRAFLSFALEVETEGRLPWRRPEAQG
jgi:uncharacterized membrane protein